MKRFPIIGTLLLLPALALPLIVGCTKETKDAKPAADAKPGDAKPGDGGKGQGGKEVAAPGTSKVAGVVKFKGTPPAANKVEAMAKHKESAMCLAGEKVNPNNVLEQVWLVNKDGGVANVVISLEPADGGKYKIDDKFRDSFKTKNVIFDQPFCAYTPHAVAVYAKVQPFVIKNSSELVHNVKIIPGPKNEGTNKIMGPKSELEAKFFNFEKEPIHIACDIHSWMSAKLLTFDHPYFAVTNEDGSFEIADVPTDADLTVYIWHESMAKKESRPNITTKTGANPLNLEVGGK